MKTTCEIVRGLGKAYRGRNKREYTTWSLIVVLFVGLSLTGIEARWQTVSILCLSIIGLGLAEVEADRDFLAKK